MRSKLPLTLLILLTMGGLYFAGLATGGWVRPQPPTPGEKPGLAPQVPLLIQTIQPFVLTPTLDEPTSVDTPAPTETQDPFAAVMYLPNWDSTRCVDHRLCIWSFADSGPGTTVINDDHQLCITIQDPARHYQCAVLGLDSHRLTDLIPGHSIYGEATWDYENQQWVVAWAAQPSSSGRDIRLSQTVVIGPIQEGLVVDDLDCDTSGVKVGGDLPTGMTVIGEFWVGYSQDGAVSCRAIWIAPAPLASWYDLSTMPTITPIP